MPTIESPLPAAARARTLSNRILTWTPRIAVTAWAGFWAWFVVMAGTTDFHQGLRGTIPVVIAWLGALSALTAAVWIWPRVGGILMVIAGIGAACYFNNSGARLLLAAPAVVVGIAALASASARTKRSV
jgi:hypothetical protein